MPSNINWILVFKLSLSRNETNVRLQFVPVNAAIEFNYKKLRKDPKWSLVFETDINEKLDDL